MFLWWIPWRLLRWWTLTLCTLTLLESLEGLKQFSSLTFCRGILAHEVYPDKGISTAHLTLFRRSVDEYDSFTLTGQNSIISRLKASLKADDSLGSSVSLRSLETSFDDLLEGMGGSPMQKFDSSNTQRFATQPAPQTAVIGSTAVLPCRVMSKVGQLQWTRNGFGLGTDRGLFGFSRYTMIGSDDEGDFSLKIHPVTLDDDAIYQCQVSAGDNVPAIQSRPVRLTVYVPPNPPKVRPPVLQTTSGMSITLECESRGGRPPPDIQWVDDSQRETIRIGANETKILMDDKLRTIVKSTLIFTPLRRHDNQTISCSTSNQALSSPLTNSIRLQVHFPPEVELTSEPEQFVEGEEATFRCEGVANPSQVTYRWYLNAQEMANETSKVFKIQKISRKYHQSSVSCEVSNKVGASKKTQTIFVRFGPFFQSNPKNLMAEIGAEVDLKCNVSSNPEPSIAWIREGSDKIIGTGAVLRVKVSPNTAGTYNCIASIAGRDYDFPTLKGTVKVLVKGPPLILSKSEQQGRMGDTVRLECNTLSIPKPMKITWMYKGRNIDKGDPRYEFDQQEEGLRNILVIRQADSKDFGDYNCSVINEYGVARKLIRLKEEKRVPVLLVVGCAVGVVLVAVIAASLVFCNKRHSSIKAHPPPEKAAAKSGENGNQPLASMYSAPSETKLDQEEETTCASSFQRPFGEVKVSPAPSPRMFPEIIRENLQRDQRPKGPASGGPTFAFTLKNLANDVRGVSAGSVAGSETQEKAMVSAYPPFMEPPRPLLTDEASPSSAFVSSSRRASLTDVSIYSPTQRMGPMSNPPEFCTIRRTVRAQDPSRSKSPPVAYHNGMVGLGTANHGRSSNGSVSHVVNRHSAYISSPTSGAYSPPPPPPPYPRSSSKLALDGGSPKAMPRANFNISEAVACGSSGQPISRVNYEVPGVNNSAQVLQRANFDVVSGNSPTRSLQKANFEASGSTNSTQEAKYIFSPEAMLKPGTLV